jgi:hypothetical protein
MTKLPPTGSRVRVLWQDIVGYINQPLKDAKVADVWTEGKLVKVEAEFLVIATSQYIDDEPADQTLGDYTAIPLGAVKSVVKRR